MWRRIEHLSAGTAAIEGSRGAPPIAVVRPCQWIPPVRCGLQPSLGNKKLDVQKYHDFILSQGLMPPAMLRKAVMAEFVPQAN